MSRPRPAVRRAAGAAVVLLGVLAGCAAPPPAPAAPAPTDPAPLATPGPVSPTGPGTGPDAAACTDIASTASTVRSIAAAAAAGPVLPAGVALFLLTARDRAARPGVTDPGLAAAQAELAAAIDDLDAQGRALLPPGGDAARDPVPLDPARVVAAVEQVERICAGRN